MIRVDISAEAIRDIRDARRFYEAMEAGAGRRIAALITRGIEQLEETAGIHPVFYRRFHRMLSQRHPFGTFYSRKGDVVTVVAVIDLRRDPDWIYRRLTD